MTISMARIQAGLTLYLENTKSIYIRVNPHAVPEEMAANWLSRDRAQEQLALLVDAIGDAGQLRGKNLLEIGSGYGMFIVAANQAGIHARGCEPHEPYYSFNQKVLAAHSLSSDTILCHVGELLPYSAATFDIVYSAHVLEHVQDPQKVIQEAWRVLKLGGCMQLVVPNYQSFWELHYHIPWIPNISHGIARRYVAGVWQRSPDYLDTLNFINPAWLRRVLAELDYVQIVSWGKEVWSRRLRTQNFCDWSEARQFNVGTVVRWVHRAKLVNLADMMGKRLGFYTPIILTVQKL